MQCIYLNILFLDSTLVYALNLIHLCNNGKCIENLHNFHSEMRTYNSLRVSKTKDYETTLKNVFLFSKLS